MSTLRKQFSFAFLLSILLFSCGQANPGSAPATLPEPSNDMGESSPNPSHDVRLGDWSAGGADLSVTDQGATLDLSCGSAILNEPLVLDDQDAFHVDGAFSSGINMVVIGPDGTTHGSQNQPATFSGHYDADTGLLVLQITLKASHQVFSPIYFNYGKPAEPILHCESNGSSAPVPSNDI
jgi:hypothetical protein